MGIIPTRARYLVMVEEHAILPPSSAHQWVPCPGSIKMSEGIIEEESEESRQGTAAHWVAEQMLQGVVIEVDTPAPNGILVDEEMIEGGSIYRESLPKLYAPYIEQRVAIKYVHSDNWGTPDLWDYNPVDQVLTVADYKYGHGSVLAYENWQLIDYAIGILEGVTGGNGLGQSPIVVNFIICQPRCYDGNGAIRTWSVKAEELRAYANQLIASANEALSFNPQCHVGNHCKNCLGRFRCQSLLTTTSYLADYSMSASHGLLTDEALGYELHVLSQAVDIMKFRKNALEAEAEARIKSNSPIPGYSLQQGYGRDSWTQPVEDVIALGDVMGVDFRAPPVVKTPTQCKAMLKKLAIDGAVINSYHGKQPTSMKIVEDDGSKAKLIFSKETI